MDYEWKAKNQQPALPQRTPVRSAQGANAASYPRQCVPCECTCCWGPDAASLKQQSDAPTTSSSSLVQTDSSCARWRASSTFGFSIFPARHRGYVNQCLSLSPFSIDDVFHVSVSCLTAWYQPCNGPLCKYSANVSKILPMMPVGSILRLAVKKITNRWQLFLSVVIRSNACKFLLNFKWITRSSQECSWNSYLMEKISKNVCLNLESTSATSRRKPFFVIFQWIAISP